MRIDVNGAPQEVPDGLSVAELLDALGVDRRHIAVELNLEIVPRAEHASTELAEGDRVEIVTMVGGG